MIRKNTGTKVELTFWQRRKLGRMAFRTKKRDARHAERAAQPGDRPSLIVTVITIALSVAVAVPSQFDWFLAKLAHGLWSDPAAWRAVAYTLLVEVLCWLCAILYARSMREHPVRLFRIGTFVFAGTAAWINYDHGREVNPTIGIVSALGSLMGVGAWELYMHRARHDATGLTLVEVRLQALRWRRHPMVMRAAAGYRAVHGSQMSRETAWRMAWVAKHGAPEVPVPVTDPRVRILLAPGSHDGLVAEPASSDPASAGVAVAERKSLSLPLGWAELTSAGAIVEQFWPELPQELGLELPATEAEPGQRNTEPKRVPKPASAPTQKPTSAPVATSTVPAAEGERKPGRKVLGGLVRNSASSDRVRFAPTPAELNGEGTALDRIGRYLSRAEAEGQSLGALDRKYIAGQFNVSDRQVRNSIKAYNAVKAEGK
ncbi:hypothetical protein ACFWMR_02055 [Amycolatopsis thailandensis]|uniref:hypothetical protein n=1 Tax=Amycolatopsis thailandensis TaxID=589330 RepID=UPI003665513C